MKKILSIILMCIALISNAQVRSVQQQSVLHHWFDLVEYDSLAQSNADTSANAYWSKQTQTYFFWDNSKIQTWEEAFPAGWSYIGEGYWKGSLIETIMIDSSNPQDTFDTERLYIDGEGRDSAFAYILDAYSVFEDRMITVLDYDSANLVESRIHIYESWYNNFVADTSFIEWCFYDSNGKLDSIISTDKDGVRFNPGGYYFEKNSQGRVSKVFEIGPINEKGGQLDTVAIHEAVFKDSLVNEIRYYYYDYRFGKDSVYFGGVLRFGKMSNSTIGLPENETQTISVYPNPVKDYFVLEIPADAAAVGEVQLLNAVGQLYSLKAERYAGGVRVDVSTLPSGFYMGNYIDSSGHSSEFKFVK